MNVFFVVLGVWILCFALCVYIVVFSDVACGIQASGKAESWKRIGELFLFSPVVVIAGIAWTTWDVIFGD
jgi:hypothetical protein